MYVQHGDALLFIIRLLGGIIKKTLIRGNSNSGVQFFCSFNGTRSSFFLGFRFSFRVEHCSELADKPNKGGVSGAPGYLLLPMHRTPVAHSNFLKKNKNNFSAIRK